MIFIKNRSIIGTIGKIIGKIFKFIYKLIDLFCLQFVIIVGLIGVVLYFTGAIREGDTGYIVVAFALIISVVYAIMGTIKKCLGVSKKSKTEGVQIVDQTTKKPRKWFKKKQEPVQTEQVEVDSVEPLQQEQPTYYKVKNKTNYVMAEFSDRYELFRVENGKLIRIRTDYK